MKKVEIKVEADSKKAESSMSRLQGATKGLAATMKSLVSPVRNVMMAFASLTMVTAAVGAVVAVVKSLHDAATSSARAMSELWRSAESQRMDRSLEGVISSHRRLKELLEDELDAQKKLNELAQIGKANARSAEDARTRLDRAERIAAETDPNKRRQLREQFAAEDEETARRRNAEDAGTRAGNAEQTAGSYRRKAGALRETAADLDRQIREQEVDIRFEKPRAAQRVFDESLNWWDRFQQANPFEIGEIGPREVKRRAAYKKVDLVDDADPTLKAMKDRLKAMKEERERLVKEAEKYDREADYYSKRAELEKPKPVVRGQEPVVRPEQPQPEPPKPEPPKVEPPKPVVRSQEPVVRAEQPQPEPPKAQPEPPKAEQPKPEPPKAEPPKPVVRGQEPVVRAEPPKVEPPKAEPPEPPKAQPEPPKAEQPFPVPRSPFHSDRPLITDIEAETGWQDTKRAQDKAQADFERERARRNAERQWASEYSKADDGRKQVLLREREAAAKVALQEAEKALAEEMQKDVRERSDERMAEARRGITEADNALFDVSHRRDELEKKEQLWWDRADERETAVLQRGADALDMGTRTKYNAIGLGDGIDTARSDARAMIEKLSELVRVTKENKPPMPQKIALFGE